VYSLEQTRVVNGGEGEGSPYGTAAALKIKTIKFVLLHSLQEVIYKAAHSRS
jgi:hypothetical protein